MEKDHRLEIRLTGKEYRALQRFAKSENKTMTDVVRSRVLNAALNYDPRQTVLFEERRLPHRVAS